MQPSLPNYNHNNDDDWDDHCHDKDYHHDLHKGKTRWGYWWSVLRVKLHCRLKCICLLGLAILVVAFIIHRMVALTLTTKEWAPSPIQFIERECPEPSYETLEQVGQHVDPSKVCLTTLTDQQKADWFQSLFKWRQFNDLLPMTWPNKQAYAAKHGYQLYDSSDLLDNSRPPSWSKIKAVQRLLSLSTTTMEEDGGRTKSRRDNHNKKNNNNKTSKSPSIPPPSPQCEWVVWWDADTVIMNSDKRIHDIFPVQGDFIVTKQKVNSYNAGAWIIKNTPWSHAFLQTWWDMDSFVRVKGLSVSGDNDALFHYLTQDMPRHEFQQHVVVPPRCTFNSVTKWVTPTEALEFQQSPEAIPHQEWYLHEEYYHQGDLIAHVAGTSCGFVSPCSSPPSSHLPTPPHKLTPHPSTQVATIRLIRPKNFFGMLTNGSQPQTHRRNIPKSATTSEYSCVIVRVKTSLRKDSGIGLA